MLPVLQVLSEDPYGIFCLVLTPTRYGAAPGGLGPGRPVPEGPGRPRLSSVLPGRELAYQIAEQFRVLGKPLGLKDCVVVGGLGEWSEPPPGPGAAGLGGSRAPGRGFLYHGFSCWRAEEPFWHRRLVGIRRVTFPTCTGQTVPGSVSDRP